MTRILCDNNSRILRPPSPTPWRVEAGQLSESIVTVFPGKKRHDNKNATFPNAVFPVF